MSSRWQVLAAAAGGSDQVLATTPARGFETRIALASTASTFAVRAVSANGRVLATSARGARVMRTRGSQAGGGHGGTVAGARRPGSRHPGGGRRQVSSAAT